MQHVLRTFLVLRVLHHVLIFLLCVDYVLTFAIVSVRALNITVQAVLSRDNMQLSQTLQMIAVIGET